jgi:hypothetical protein
MATKFLIKATLDGASYYQVVVSETGPDARRAVEHFVREGGGALLTIDEGETEEVDRAPDAWAAHPTPFGQVAGGFGAEAERAIAERRIAAARS